MKKTLLAAAVLAVTSAQVNAFKLDTPDDWEIRWDNTTKVNVMGRTEKPDSEVYTPGKQPGWSLADDSTLSVERGKLGIISARMDILSELDVVYKYDFGFRVSAAGWYDPMYKDSDHPRNRTGTWGQPSVRPGWDLTVPMTVGYTLGGDKKQAPFTFGGNQEGGTASIGAELLINQQWTVSASYAARFGPVTAGIGGLLTDRDTVSLTIKRTF